MENALKGIFAILSLVVATLLISQVALAQLSATDVTVDGEREENNIKGNITLSNTAGSTLSGFSFNLTQADFSDGTNNIAISFSSPASIANGASANATVTVNIPSDIKLDTYSGTVNVTATNGTSTFLDSFTLRVDIRPIDLCKKGRVGDLEIADIDDPSDGDNFNPLELIKVRVKVENNFDNDLDVEFKAFLVDKEDDDNLDEITDVVNIDEDKDETFDLSLKVPADIKEETSTRYAVYVMAAEDGDEEEHCAWDKVDIEIEKDKDDVLITNLDTEELICGISNEVFATVVNAGSNDQNDMIVELSIPTLNLKAKSAKFDLDEADDQSVFFSLDIPKGISEGTYNVEVSAKDEDGVLFKRGSKSFALSVSCAAPKISASLSLSQTSFTSRKDASISTTATVKNTGDATATFKLRVTPATAWTDAQELSLDLDAGESKTEVLTLIVNAEGSHSAKVEVLADSNVVASSQLSVNAVSVPTGGEGVIALPPALVPTGGIVGTIQSQLPLAIIIAVLALIIIILIIWLIVSYTRAGSASEREWKEVRRK